jgi:hypothetical protein
MGRHLTTTQVVAEWSVAAIQHVRLVKQILENFFLFLLLPHWCSRDH